MAGLTDFALDFGISISRETIGNVVKLAAAIKTTKEFISDCIQGANDLDKTLRSNVLRLGSFGNVLREVEAAQNRLASGKTFFGVSDQLKGMENMRKIGMDVGKSFDFISKSAHATGKTFEEFSGMIASAVAGNTNALVEAGIMTQRATRMFEKYRNNTVERREAILGFLQQHKGLLNAIKNDFFTVSDYLNKIRETWKYLVRTFIGRPNDPDSLWGSVIGFAKKFEELFSKVAMRVKKYMWGAGQVLGYFIRQATNFMEWVARKIKPHIDAMWGLTDQYKEQVRSFIVWLDFWKVHLIKVMKEYKNLILGVLGAWALFSVKLPPSVWKPLERHLTRVVGWIIDIVGWIVKIGRFVLSVKGFIITATTALFVYLYNKSEKYRGFVNEVIKNIWEGIKLIGNIVTFVVQGIVASVRWLWENVLSPSIDWIGEKLTALFDENSTFMKCLKSVGEWIEEWIIDPLSKFINWIGGKLSALNNWLSGTNAKLGGYITEGDPNARNAYTSVVGSMTGGDRSNIDTTNYGRKAVDTIKSTYNKIAGNTNNTVNLYSPTNITVNGSIIDEELDKLEFKLTRIQERNKRDMELRMGK